MVGATGFEPATSWSQTKCSTRLSYAPFRQDTSIAQPRTLASTTLSLSPPRPQTAKRPGARRVDGIAQVFHPSIQKHSKHADGLWLGVSWFGRVITFGGLLCDVHLSSLEITKYRAL